MQVECDPVCRKILAARMMEGSLPQCAIMPDVCGYHPSQSAVDAEWLLAGFPCQASFSDQSRAVASLCASLIQLDRSLLQGLSQAGDQQGLDDVRSALVKEVFLVFDRMPNGRESQK